MVVCELKGFHPVGVGRRMNTQENEWEENEGQCNQMCVRLHFQRLLAGGSEFEEDKIGCIYKFS